MVFQTCKKGVQKTPTASKEKHGLIMLRSSFNCVSKHEQREEVHRTPALTGYKTFNEKTPQSGKYNECYHPSPIAFSILDGEMAQVFIYKNAFSCM